MPTSRRSAGISALFRDTPAVLSVQGSFLKFVAGALCRHPALELDFWHAASVGVVCVVELMLKITARPDGVPAMFEALATVMFQAKLEIACLDSQIYAESGNPQSLLYLEQWSTLEDLELQLRSQRFARLLAIMETATAPPKLEVRTVIEQRGLEYVRSVRLGTSTARPPHPSE